jgi:TolA-binding protein
MQEDVDFRLSERGGQRGGAAPAPQATRPANPSTASTADARARASRRRLRPRCPAWRRRRSAPARPDHRRGVRWRSGAGPDGSLQRRAPPVPDGALPPATPRGPSVAATGQAGSPRELYDLAYAHVLRKEYERAEMSFREFLQSYPRDRLAADATFWLGESYFQRRRYREAARAVFEDLARLPEGEQGAPTACSSSACPSMDLARATRPAPPSPRVGVDYPGASNAVRQGVEPGAAARPACA